MIRYALLAAGLSLVLASAGHAVPLSPTPQLALWFWVHNLGA
jgi:hypothetical protein